MNIRACEQRDIAAVRDIYNHYIETTTITFEETPVGLAEMEARVAAYSKLYPWLVCEDDGQVTGYAYATKWKERAAYRHTAEVTVYVRDGAARRGYGRALYTALLPRLSEMGCHIALGCIALPNPESIGLHEAFGFRSVAHFDEVGRKFDRWIDVGYWQLHLGANA